MKRDAAREVSLSALLQLDAGQTGRLMRLHDGLLSRRRAENARLAPNASTSKSEARRGRLVADLLGTRAKATLVLPPVQRSQLEALAGDPRFTLRRDALYELLLAPVDESGTDLVGASKPGATKSGATDAQGRRNWLEARRLDGSDRLNRAQGVGSYGVYTGYGYGGPQAGVYGGYQQGAVGVHAGIGLGGPSIGVNIGRVFGVGRR